MTRIGIVGTGIIALPNFMHFDAAQQALAAGKHVFCEKPTPSANSISHIKPYRSNYIL